MCVKKLIYLASFVLVLSLVGDVQAAVFWWSDADPADHLWSTPGNWDLNALPTIDDLVRINIVPGPTVANEGAVASGILLYDNGALTVDGGTVNPGWFPVGLDSTGTLNMISGAITVSSNFWVGHNGGDGTVNMTGGTITCANFDIPQTEASTGHVNLHGGTINGGSADNFGMLASGSMDVRAGTLILGGNSVSVVQGYIDNGQITAYDGNGTFQLDYDVTNEGATTLESTHNLNPNPLDGSSVSPGDVELSWTLPEPSVPGQPVPVDVYFTDDLTLLEQFTDPAAIQVVNKQNVTSVVVQTQPKTRYYWAVDAYVETDADPVIGLIFSFLADNMPPKVDAGADIVTLLEGDSRTGNLDATVTDDGAISPYTVQWTVISEPNEGAAVIETATAEDTSITLTALGEYAFQLEAFDGEYSDSDTVTINVYSDSCQAAQSLPDYVPLVGDLNGDCRVDEADLALLEENWLQDNSLTEDWFKVD